MSCGYGTEECCGEVFYSTFIGCHGPEWTWSLPIVSEACFSDWAWQCLNSTTTETPSDECPESVPFSEECTQSQKGLKCGYEEEECCGSKGYVYNAECDGSSWSVLVGDSACAFGNIQSKVDKF